MIETSAAYQTIKLWLIDGTGLGKDALHIYAGLAVFLTARGLWRWRRPGLAAWIATLLVACAAEWVDLQGEALRGRLAPDAAHWHDIWNTMFWPTILSMIDGWRRRKTSGENAERRLEQA
jgi:hypothetical protein